MEFKNTLKQADCLFSKEDIQIALDRMAHAINQDMRDKNPLVICIMNGGLVTMGQLLTRLDFPLEIDYLHATRYRGALQGEAKVEWLRYPSKCVKNRHVLLVDDILDEGHTLVDVLCWFEKQGAASINLALLVEKIHDRRAAGIYCQYPVLQVPDRYVFGYGMDYREYWRNADGIYALRE